MLIDKPDVIRWCYEGVTENTLANTSDKALLDISNKVERGWGNGIMGTADGGQWTTTFCQNLVKEALEKLGRKNVRATTRMKASLKNKSYDPDLECDQFVYEVKGRSWTMSGTAGEKILGVPLKYGEVPRLYHKPLKIILIGYQEWEARRAWQFGDLLDSNNQTEELKEALAYHKQHGIEYVGFTDILKELGYPYGWWK
jgi:hypothetical protein